MIAVFEKIIFFTVVILLCAASGASGLDLAATGRLGATVTDNIYRSPKGSEEGGSILTQGFGVEISKVGEERSFILSLEGGWETLETKRESSSEDVYRLDLSFTFPLSRKSWMEGTASASRETTTPEADAPHQGRIMEKVSEAGFLVGNHVSEITSWEAEFGVRRENQEDLDLEETTGSIRWSRDLSRVRTFSVEGSVRDGSDEFEETSWRGNSAALSLTERLSSSFTRGFSLDWENWTLEEEDGNRTSSWRAGVAARYESRRPTGWSHEGSLGISRLTLISGDKTWESAGSFSMEKNLSRTTVADAGIEIRNLMQDPRESEVERTRQGHATAGLGWAISRKFSLEPRVSYLFEDIIGTEVPDREDQTFIGRVNARWTPYPTWLMEFAFVMENRESTEPSEELVENRIELRASSVFR